MPHHRVSVWNFLYYPSVELLFFPLFYTEKEASVANDLYLYFLNKYLIKKWTKNIIIELLSSVQPLLCVTISLLCACSWHLMQCVGVDHPSYSVWRCFYQGQTCSCQGHCRMERKAIVNLNIFICSPEKYNDWSQYLYVYCVCMTYEYIYLNANLRNVPS